MGLTMSERKSLTRENARRYRRAPDKKSKQKILDEFVANTGYHRKYAIGLLGSWGKKVLRHIEGKPVKIVIGQPRKRRKRMGNSVYGKAVRKALELIWELFDYMCGKRLAVLIRMNIEMIAAQPELDIDQQVKAKLIRISPATIDRLLTRKRKATSLKGRSHTRPGTLLKHNIPIRTSFDWDERVAGFFELDTVAHDGGAASGEYCYSLDATDVASGWTEIRALRNRAHTWVKQEVEQIRAELPFQLQGVDSDNGGEFINYQLWDYCKENHLLFTRSRPYRKNDNCFVEQKNDMAIRRTVGYYRFDTEEEFLALQEVYLHLCPLLNFYYPSMKLIEKIREGERVKRIYEPPKPAYQRLLESETVEQEVKEELRRRATSLHIVKQKHLVDRAVARLMRAYENKKQPLLHLETDDGSPITG